MLPSDIGLTEDEELFWMVYELNKKGRIQTPPPPLQRELLFIVVHELIKNSCVSLSPHMLLLYVYQYIWYIYIYIYIPILYEKVCRGSRTLL